VRLLSDDGVVLGGVEVEVDSSLPVGAGLSSSAALVCATLGALLDATGLRWDRQRIALAAQRVENEYLGAPVGVMDPTVVMHAHAAHALLLDTRTLAREQIPLPLVPPDDREGCTLLVVDTHASHSTGDHAYAERVTQCAAAAEMLGVASLRDVETVDALAPIADPVLLARARHVVSENRRVLTVASLLRQGRVQDVGPLLTASHRSLRDDFAVSTDALDLVVSSALVAGAWGGRVTGAGFGGSAVLLVPAARAHQVAEMVRESLVAQGMTPPTVRAVRASDAAGRVL
jgi:galactokinase